MTDQELLVAVAFIAAFCWPFLALGGLVWWFWRSDQRPDVPAIERGRVPESLLALVLAAGVASLIGLGAAFTHFGLI
ncbi:hypothetical protein [Alienimonas californiensis]|uniref:Uncharacterized protein n=1 Tax=Alienimonas californiensis TaxID=2527989 RepID=A0A517P6C5_9PLAN|nr:hypothetical protein [Alienimonas californiensis]QDT14924.1 hypothetical protein CA12_10040 [Alienimonas californiensis]